MDFALLMLVTVVLFIRPSELVPQLATVPVYELVILPCLAVSVGPLLSQLSGESLRRQPITVCALGQLILVVVSNVANLYFDVALDFGVTTGKIILYYLLVVGIVNSRRRLWGLMTCVVAADLLATALAVLQYRGVVNIPSLVPVTSGLGGLDPETGVEAVVRRLCGPGLFHDPNDMSLNLTVAMMLSLYGATDRRTGPLRVLWLAPVGLFGYALSLTHSRGGFLALMGGLLTLLVARFGTRRAMLLSLVVLPVALALFGGRMTNIGSATSEDTGQERVQVWTEGIALFLRSPVFGVGTGKFEEFVGKPAHNSFLNVFVELGFVGGTLFLGSFYYAGERLYRLGMPGARVADPELRRMRPYLLAALACFTVGMTSTNFSFAVPTFAILGLAAAYLRLADPDPPPGARSDERLAKRLAAVGIVVLVATYLFVRLNVRWG